MQYSRYATFHLSPKKTGLLVPSIKGRAVSHLRGFPVCVLKVLAILTVCCWIVSSAASSFKRLDGVAKAEEVHVAKAGAGEHSFQFEFRECPWSWNPLPWPTKNALPLSICTKTRVVIFLSKLDKGVSGRGNACGTFGKALLSYGLTNKRVRSRNMSVITAAD